METPPWSLKRVSGLGSLCKLLFSSGWLGAGILTGAVGGDFLVSPLPFYEPYMSYSLNSLKGCI